MTPFAAQVFDLERAIDDLALQKVLRDERRQDLPGAPLNWEVALDELVSQLVRHPAPVSSYRPPAA